MHLSHPTHDTSPFKISSSYIIKYLAWNPTAISYFLCSHNMHILIVKFLQSTVTSALLDRHILLGTQISNSLSVFFPRHMRKLSHKQHTTAKITILYTVISMFIQRTERQKIMNTVNSLLFCESLLRFLQ